MKTRKCRAISLTPIHSSCRKLVQPAGASGSCKQGKGTIRSYRFPLSDSKRTRPGLPFQVNLRFAKTEPWLGFCSFEIPEYTPKLPRWLAGLLSRLGLLIIANYYDAAAMVLHSARCRTTCAEKKQRLNAAAFSPLRPFPPPDARRARLIERRARQQC